MAHEGKQTCTLDMRSEEENVILLVERSEDLQELCNVLPLPSNRAYCMERMKGLENESD